MERTKPKLRAKVFGLYGHMERTKPKLRAKVFGLYKIMQKNRNLVGEQKSLGFMDLWRELNLSWEKRQWLYKIMQSTNLVWKQKFWTL